MAPGSMSRDRGVQIPSGSPATETPSPGQATFFGDPDPEIFLAGQSKGTARSIVDGFIPYRRSSRPRLNAQRGGF